ncbi:putative bifunctional diguanylate cyclase/phosphodiesterase [Oryzomonas rubra]|uniref:EAL domain-containing protein n=1 Tax=Oryzomonas rubra TaxID=2509454 RepID=A0A5A9XUZ5_9BACT|nr:EAL domain-containing protein [Oryzomonas rubra]KAA0895421.1 EAL domain-containing protein [Oryzomonas rubra]
MPYAEIIRVLLIEDNPADVRLLRECFSELSDVLFLVHDANCIASSIQLVSEKHFDVILLDLSLPDSIGLETLHRMHTQAPDIPIIVLTGMSDDALALTAMRHGAQDYLLKGQFDINLLSRAIRYTIERKRAEAEIKKLAYYDTLTGLPNRVLFSDRLKQAIVMAERDKKSLALLYLDLDQFKYVNDTLGHAYGDRLLKISADRIQGCLRSSDTVARIGGDEFVIILSLLSGGDDVPKVADKILEALRKPVQFENHTIHTSASIGIALYPENGTTVDELLKNADISMYQAKEKGRNNYQFFSEEMNRLALARQVIESNLRQAMVRNEFFLVYQPLFDIASRTIIGFEALIRWHHPQHGDMLPPQFINIAEETGMIVAIGEWVLRTACRQARQWHNNGGSDGLRISVNVSASQLKHDSFLDIVASALEESDLPPGCLELEVNESTIIEQGEKSIPILKKLKKLGVSLAVDDFGTGYSSLSYLKHFPIDRVKIDGTFVRDITPGGDNAAIAEAIIFMAHSLRLNVVAEGVEQEKQYSFLHNSKCDELQGFFMCHPLLPEDIIPLLRTYTTLTH